MNELSEPGLKRPMDRSVMASDDATIRQLVGMLNDPRITGADAPPEERPTMLPTDPLNGMIGPKIPPPKLPPLPAPPISGPQTPHQRFSAPPKAPTPVAPVAVSLHQPAQNIFFTGHPGAGKSWLAQQIKGSRVFEFDDPIYALAATVFGDVSDVSLLTPFVAEVRAWGEGVLSSPLTPARAMFIDYMREAGKSGDELMGVPVSEFGTAGFWTRCLIARITRHHMADPKSVVAITHIETPVQWRLLVEKGFRPYHVACPSAVRVARGAKTESSVAVAIDRDITAKLSQQKDGGKLWCIWNSPEHPSPSQRLLSVQEFLAAYK